MNQVKWMAAPFNCMWSLSSAVLAENWVRHATSTWKTNASAYSICLRPLSIYFIYSGAFLRSYNWIFDNFWLSCWRLHTIFIQTHTHRNRYWVWFGEILLGKTFVIFSFYAMTRTDFAWCFWLSLDNWMCMWTTIEKNGIDIDTTNTGDATLESHRKRKRIASKIIQIEIQYE